MKFVKTITHDLDWAQFDLILPAVSIGNVGQLAIDLLINTIEDVTHCGYIDDANVLPVIGSNPFSSDFSKQRSLSTNFEVFYSEKQKSVFLQFRAPLLPNKADEFVSSLYSWIEEKNFVKIVILSSCEAFRRIDSQLLGSQFRYVVSKQCQDLNDLFKKEFNWTEMEKRSIDSEFPSLSNNELQNLYMPGSGFTKRLFELCSVGSRSVIIFSTFCSEGDNIPDALFLVSHVNQWLRLVSEPSRKVNPNDPWKMPISWKLLFGNPPPDSIY